MCNRRRAVKNTGGRGRRSFMKKFAMVFLATAFALGCALSLSACKDDPAGGGADEPMMTRAEWSASLTEFSQGNNYTVTVKVGGQVYQTMKLDDTTYYDNGFGVERVITNIDEQYSLYEKRGSGDWTKSSVNISYYNSVVENNRYTVLAGVAAIDSHYTSFEFSNGVYTAAEVSAGSAMTLKDVQLTTRNKKITKIVCTREDDGTATLVTVDGIGSTSITVPQVGGGTGGGGTGGGTTDEKQKGPVSAEVWANSFNFKEIVRNVTYIDTGAVTGSFELAVDGDVYSYKKGDTTLYYTKEGDKYYVYEPTDDGYEKSETTEENYLSNLQFISGLDIMRLAEKYDSFEYQEDNGRYFAELISFSAGGMTAYTPNVAVAFKDRKSVV